jgi:hypothetical protein
MGEPDDGRVATGTSTATETTRGAPAKSGCRSCALAAVSASALGLSRRKITHTSTYMGDANEIVCPYCSTLFRFNQSLGAYEADPAYCAYGGMD